MKKRTGMIYRYPAAQVFLGILLAFFLQAAFVQMAEGAVCTSVKAAGAELRKGLIQRKNTIVVTAKISGSYDFETAGRAMSDIRDGIYDEALSYTGAGNAGEYLYWNLAGISKSVELTDIDDSYIEVDCTYMFTYRDNASCESSLSGQVKSALNSLKLSGKNDYEKVRAIYDYIAGRVKYDDGEAASSSILDPLSYTAYGALVNKRAVCQGYSLLFYRMCNDAGIDCRVITGKAKGSNGTEQHAWNAVKISGRFYNVDVTWDATMKQAGRDYEYFLKSNGDLKNHARDAIFTTAAFNKECPMSSTSFPGASGAKKYKVKINGGSGSGTYSAGTVLTIKAASPVAGQAFSRWNGTATYVDKTSATKASAKIKVTKDVTLTATYAYVNAAVSNGKYRLNSRKQAAKFMSVKANSKATNAQIVLGSKKASTAMFTISKSGGYYYIMNTNTKKYLNLSGNKVVQGARNSTSRWRLVKSSSGIYRLVNQNGKTATLSSTNVTAAADTNNVSQQVKLMK